MKSQNKEPEIVPNKVLSEAGELIREGHKIMRIENDTQIQMATLRPRDEGLVLDKIIAELERTPEFAKKVFYSIPYEDNRNNKTTYVEGISIGGAMAIARRWGNCANASRVVEEVEDGFIVEGVFMDYENNVRTLRPFKVTRFYKPRGGGNAVVPLSHDALQKAIAAGLSKAVRNAVLHGVPEAIKIQYLKEAKRISTMEKAVDGKLKEKSLQDLIKELADGFGKHGFTMPEIIQVNGKPNVSREDYQKLLGILNALDDNFTTKAEVMGGEFKPTTQTHKPVKLDEIL